MAKMKNQDKIFSLKHLIIVPIYNNPRLTRRCLESLVLNTDLKKNLLYFINDGSNKQTKAYLEKFHSKHPETLLHRNSKNIGKPESVNQTLKKFPKMDYYTIIDNDVYLKSKNWVITLIKAHQDWHDKAILGAYTYLGGFPFTKNGRHYLDPWPYWTLAGCFFSFSQKIFRTLGYFYDDGYRSEDADYCRRAYLGGFKWFYLTDIKAGISGYKHSTERQRMVKKDIYEKKKRGKWYDYVMKTHKIYYSPKK